MVTCSMAYNSLVWSLVIVSLLCIFSCAIPGVSSKTSPSKHITEIACEGDTLNISCPSDQVIAIIRANYGRFSLLECNERSETWENVECSFPKSTRVMIERCQYKQSCRVPADDETFGDECPETLKYLEATYECRPAGERTMSSDGSTLLTTKPTSAPASSSRTTGFSDITVTKSSKERTVTAPLFIKKSQPSQGNGQLLYCSEASKRGLQWPETKVNNSAKIKCPNSQEEHMYAEWECSSDATWTPDHPDLSRCISSWAVKLEQKSRSVKTLDDATLIIDGLQARISDSSQFYGGDTNAYTTILRRLSKFSLEMVQRNDIEWTADKGDAVKSLTESIIQISSGLLKAEYKESWLDLPLTERTLAASALLAALENVGLAAAQNMDNETSSVRLIFPTVGLEIISVVQVPTLYLQFPSKAFASGHSDHIKLPQSVLQSSTTSMDKPTKVVIVSHDKSLGQYLSSNPSSMFGYAVPQSISQRYLASRLLSAMVLHYDPSSQRHKMAKFDRLVEPVLITLGIDKPGNASKPLCVYWDDSNKWSTNGCKLKESNSTHAVCACNHLTTFAVLMDVYGIALEAGHHLALMFITYFGCVVSIISCALAIFAFCMFRITNQADRITIHKNLCICLLIAELLFIIGIDWTEWPMVCTVVAVILHYAFLCAFAWMLLEGVELYALLIEVFQSESSRKPYFYLFGYGAPLVIVGVSLLVDYESYGTQRHCWLKTENYFVYSFVGPVIVVLAANFVFLIMALVVMCRHTNYSSAYRRDGERRSFMANVYIWWKGAIILVVLLGLTWTLGILFIIHPTVVSAYSFTVLNSLQGLFILIFHVLLNSQMRKEMYGKLQKWKGTRKGTWIRTLDGSGDYKPGHAGIADEPMLLANSAMPKDINGISGNSNVFGTLIRSLKRQSNKRGSVGPLASSNSGQSSRSAAREYHERSIALNSESVDTAMLSETMTDMSDYSTPYSLRAPPNFSPPSPPKPVPAQRRGRNPDISVSQS